MNDWVIAHWEFPEAEAWRWSAAQDDPEAPALEMIISGLERFRVVLSEEGRALLLLCGIPGVGVDGDHLVVEEFARPEVTKRMAEANLQGEWFVENFAEFSSMQAIEKFNAAIKRAVRE